MPWCPNCERFLSQPSVRPDGTCPTCGRAVEANVPAHRQGGAPGPEEELPAIPFHMKALGVALVVYLGWRFVQGVEWVIQHL